MMFCFERNIRGKVNWNRLALVGPLTCLCVIIAALKGVGNDLGSGEALPFTACQVHAENCFDNSYEL